MKMLLSSWFLNLKEAELLSYDLIGKCYYYEGDTEKSVILHRKSLLGLNEPDYSSIK